jgi:zinc/manganese transport system substrate-binding protein
MLFAAAACGATASPGAEPDSKQPVPKPTGPISVVASINQWGSLAAELGGDDVEVTSIVSSTNVDAHDFEPKTSDMAKLSKAGIVVTNGAGYDSWATKSLAKTSTVVSAASVMGAMEGDNPHLWFSKDARSGMATEITEAYIKALPSKKKAFQKRLDTWQAGERSLEQWVGEFTKAQSDLTYAATEPVAYYLMADLGFKDSTPKGYAQSTAAGGEVAPADLQSFQKLIEDRDINVLINNIQEASDATNMITGTAGRSDIPVVDVSEQMPEDAASLNDWINQLINSIIDAVDPSYGCKANETGDADSDDGDDGDDGTPSDGATKDDDAAGDDGNDDSADGASDDADTSTGKAGEGDSDTDGDGTDNADGTDGASSDDDEKTPRYSRQCPSLDKADRDQ